MGMITEEEYMRALKVIESVEWNAEHHYDNDDCYTDACPRCGGVKPIDPNEYNTPVARVVMNEILRKVSEDQFGHRSDCELAAVLYAK